MLDLRYSLVSDGSSDAALLPILSWLLRENGVLADSRFFSTSSTIGFSSVGKCFARRD
jgi:hypothetical protein